MKITIGMLAWNEENSIASTIQSLGRQTLLKRADGAAFIIEIIIVPNGCTDRTAEVSAAALEGVRCEFPLVATRVEALAEGGKVNAWNEFVHRLAPPDADYMILMDADIEMLTPRTLESMWQLLEDNAHVVIATDLPVKHLVRHARLGLKDRILLGVGEMTAAAPGQLTGQLYVARAAWLRRVWIPRGLVVEDGWLKQILCTDGFSEPNDNSRIVRAEDASHLFECYTKFRDIWNHQIRQAISQTLYNYLSKYIRTSIPERPVYEVLIEKSRRDPDWFLEVIRTEVVQRGWWVMHTPALTMRWRRIRQARGAAKLKFLLIAALATPYDLAVHIAGNHRLRTGGVKGVWKDTRTTVLS